MRFTSVPLEPLQEEEVKIVAHHEEVEESSIEGQCDFHFCKERTFMRCDYDMNDLIDPRSSRC